MDLEEIKKGLNEYLKKDFSDKEKKEIASYLSEIGKPYRVENIEPILANRDNVINEKKALQQELEKLRKEKETHDQAKTQEMEQGNAHIKILQLEIEKLKKELKNTKEQYINEKKQNAFVAAIARNNIRPEIAELIKKGHQNDIIQENEKFYLPDKNKIPRELNEWVAEWAKENRTYTIETNTGLGLPNGKTMPIKERAEVVFQGVSIVD